MTTTKGKSDKRKKIKGTTENWEAGKLGLDIDSAKEASQEVQAALDSATTMKPISIRLQEHLIAELKLIASFHGIGYQPLIRDILTRFTTHEMDRILEIIENRRKLEANLSDEESPIAKHIQECA